MGMTSIKEHKLTIWRKMNTKRFEKYLICFIENIKYSLPKEHLRKIMKNVGFILDIKSFPGARAYLGALKFIPHSIFKLFEALPMPWEKSRILKTIYHSSGALSF